MKKVNKKGVLGIDLAQKFVLTLLVLAVLGVVMVIVMANLNSSSGVTGAVVTGTISNETILLTDIGSSVTADARSTLSNLIVTNATGGETIVATGNYSVSGITLTAVGASGYNGTNVNVSATWTYNDNAIASITNNVSSATEGFFGNATTWFAMLAIAVLILIIAVVIIAVRGFGGGSGEL